MSIFHRLEEYGQNAIYGKYVIVSFETKYRGIWQCRWTETGRDSIKPEPSIETLTEEEQRQVDLIGPIVYTFTYGQPPTW